MKAYEKPVLEKIDYEVGEDIALSGNISGEDLP